MAKKAFYSKIKRRSTRSRSIRAMAKTTPRGKGRIAKRPAYRKHMKKGKRSR